MRQCGIFFLQYESSGVPERVELLGPLVPGLPPRRVWGEQPGALPGRATCGGGGLPHACLFWSLLPSEDKAPTFSTETNRFSRLPLSHKVLERGAPARLRLAGQPQLWAQCLVTVVTEPSLWPDGVGGRGWDSWLWWPDGPSFLSQVVKACNEGVRKMSRTEQMICIQKKMEFKIKSVPIISHSRWLLKQGELQQMSGPKTSRTLRTKKLFHEIYLFLFNDLLVICRQIPGDKYQVFDSAPRGLLRVEELEDQGQTLANVFILRLLENADDREATYMLKASSQSEMKRWMTSLAPNRRTKFVSFTSRLLDCPQVQCVHPYVAQQPDELTLELADILNILDKTDDGWIFGERLHDQERGWFPSSMTEEILNPKIRSQNLKECFRVHKMDDPQRSQNKDRRKLGSRNRQ
uniref:Neuronal guanine nucleotide exchange factor n=1 Tax=Papio anubis TaxID=9555 RepID=A0A2I3MQD8_PAPAN